MRCEPSAGWHFYLVGMPLINLASAAVHMNGALSVLCRNLSAGYSSERNMLWCTGESDPLAVISLGQGSG